MGPPTPADPVVATNDGYEVIADRTVELNDFRLDVNNLVTTFTECTDRCRALNSVEGLNLDVCPDDQPDCSLVTSDSGTMSANKMMDVVLRAPAASALFRITLANPDLAVTGDRRHQQYRPLPGPGSVLRIGVRRHSSCRHRGDPQHPLLRREQRQAEADVLTMTMHGSGLRARRRPTRWAIASAAPVVLAAGLSACAADADAVQYQVDAERFLTGDEVFGVYGIEFRSPVLSCATPASTAAGETFTCTAQGDDGLTYHFTMQITGDNAFRAHGDHAGVSHGHDRLRPFTS